MSNVTGLNIPFLSFTLHIGNLQSTFRIQTIDTENTYEVNTIPWAFSQHHSCN